MLRLLIFCFLLPRAAYSQLSQASFNLFVEQQLEAFGVPGVAVGVIKNGEVLLAKGYGLADVAAGRTVTAQTQFAIGSATKSFTAAAVAALVDQGKVALDEPVRTYLPAFALADAYAASQLTVRDLLRHNSGLPRHDLAWYGHAVDRRTLVQRLAELEPTEPLGKRFQYQNLMYVTAGQLVEVVSGQSWEDFTRAHILEPLGMDETNFSVVDMARDADHARPYTDGEPMALRNLDAAGPAGSINSTVDDMLRYLRFHLGDARADGLRVLSARILEELHSPQQLVPGSFAQRLLIDDNGLPMAYGLGWFIANHRGRLLLEHGGNIDGFSALVSMLPDEETGIVVLTNANGSALPYVLRNRLYDELLELEVKDWSHRALTALKNAADNRPEPPRPLPDTRPSLPLVAYAGTYAHPGYGEIEVRSGSDSLYLTYAGEPDEPFGHFHYDVFINTRPEPIRIQFFLDIDAKISALEAKLEPTLPPLRFLRRTAAELRDRESFYVGEYSLRGTTLTVFRQADQLVLRVPGQPEYPLTHKAGSAYTFAPGFGVIFEQSGEQPAVSFELLQPHGNFVAIRLDPAAQRADAVAAGALNARTVAPYLGTYQTKKGLKVTLSFTDKFKMDVTGQPSYTLVPTDDKDRYRPLGLPGFFVQFERRGKSVPALVLIQPNGNFAAQRIE